MKKQRNTMIILKNKVFLHILVGLIIGFFVLHPITMVIYWFEFNTSESFINDFFKIAWMRITHSFKPEMILMSFIFSFIGGSMGLVFGLYAKTIRKSKNLIQKNEELKKLDDLKLNFLQLISHEIRTPLNGIIGSISLIKDEGSKELSNFIEMLDQSANRLDNFLVTALYITELNAHYGKLDLKPQNILSEIYYGVNQIKSSNNHNKSKHIVINSNETYKNVIVNIDRTYIQMCFKILLENALKYAENEVEISVLNTSDNNYVICEFQDDGSGFKENQLKELFMLFSGTSMHTDGSLGLKFPLIKLICENHKGKCELKNNERGGASIKLYLPIFNNHD